MLSLKSKETITGRTQLNIYFKKSCVCEFITYYFPVQMVQGRKITSPYQNKLASFFQLDHWTSTKEHY